jgi:hypothetical protein
MARLQNYECLTDVTSDTSLKQKSSELPVVEFCCSFLQEYPQMSECAAIRRLPFPTNRLYEAAFSMHVAKSKYRYRLDVAPDMKIQLSTFIPRFKGFCETKN